MTDKQKDAVEILIRERGNGHLLDDEFFTLLDIVVEEKERIYVPQLFPWQTYPATYPLVTYDSGTVPFPQNQQFYTTTSGNKTE